MWKKFFFSVFVLIQVALFSKEPIHLIWMGVDSKGLWEPDWIHEMLSDVDAPIHEMVDLNYEVFLDRSIVICSSLQPWEKYLRYFKEAKERGINFGIIHIGEELYDCPVDVYSDLQFVIRNYWHKKFDSQPNVLCVPLGYKSGFWSGFSGKIKTVSEKKYTWSFAGQWTKSSRFSMVANLVQVPGYYIHETPWFGAPNSLSTSDYRDLLIDTLFLPCPRGFWNLDSFRISEALEAGCIPIVEKWPLDYFQKFYGECPFLAVSSWNEAPQLMRHLMQDMPALEALRQECHTWWQNYKLHVRSQVAEHIEQRLKEVI